MERAGIAPIRLRLFSLLAATVLLIGACAALLLTPLRALSLAWREPPAPLAAIRLVRPPPPPPPPVTDGLAAPSAPLGSRATPPRPSTTAPATAVPTTQPPPPAAALALACLNPDPRRRPPNCPPQGKLAPDRRWRDQAVWDKGLTIPPKLAPAEKSRDPFYTKQDVAEVKMLAPPPCEGICIRGGYVPPVTYDPQTTCEKGGVGPCVRPPERNAAEAMKGAGDGE